VEKNESHPEKDGSSCVRSWEDGGLVIRLHEMSWETEFFGRRFGRLEVDAKGMHDPEAETLDKALGEILAFGDRDGFDLIELALDISWLCSMSLFEDHGFRLVDTKIRFITLKEKEEIDNLPEGEGELSFASAEMKEEILALTTRAFAENPLFKSRFNNKRYFSRSETQRYYASWIEKYLRDENALFGVMKDEGKIAGYLIYTRTGEHYGKPLYKAVLMAVAPEHRGKRIYFSLRSFVYKSFPESEIYLDTTTQLTNLSIIRNFIKTKKTLDSIKLIFYRRGSGS
jgi:hypothetical protein